MVTVAFGITAPVWSNTVPAIAPWVVDCASAPPAITRNAEQSRLTLLNIVLRLIRLSLNFRRCGSSSPESIRGHAQAARLMRHVPAHIGVHVRAQLIFDGASVASTRPPRHQKTATNHAPRPKIARCVPQIPQPQANACPAPPVSHPRQCLPPQARLTLRYTHLESPHPGPGPAPHPACSSTKPE